MDSTRDSVAKLTTDFSRLSLQYNDLKEMAGTLDDLAARVQSLEDEIEELEEQLRPLVLATNGAEVKGFFCTGSMEPAITCLDTDVVG